MVLILQFTHGTLVTPKHPEYCSSPKDKDCIHLVAIVVDATSVSSMPTKSLENLRNIKMHANERGKKIIVEKHDKFYISYMQVQ